MLHVHQSEIIILAEHQARCQEIRNQFMAQITAQRTQFEHFREHFLTLLRKRCDALSTATANNERVCNELKRRQHQYQALEEQCKSVMRDNLRIQRHKEFAELRCGHLDAQLQASKHNTLRAQHEKNSVQQQYQRLTVHLRDATLDKQRVESEKNRAEQLNVVLIKREKQLKRQLRDTTQKSTQIVPSDPFEPKNGSPDIRRCTGKTMQTRLAKTIYSALFKHSGL